MMTFMRYIFANFKCFFVILNFLLVLKLSASQKSIENETKIYEPVNSERKWVTELFEEAKTKFRMDSASTKCKEDYEMYEKHLRNQSIWAIRMKESAEWPSVGVFSGRTYHMGDYDECLKVLTKKFKGKYCLSQINYDFEDFLSSDNELKRHPDEKSSVWDALNTYKYDRIRLNRKELHFALCIPSSCKVSDLRSSLNDTLYPIFHQHGLNISVSVDPTFCSTTTTGKSYPPEYYVTLCLFVFLVSLVILCTYQDVKYKSENQDDVTVYTSFSLVKNFKKLVDLNTKNEIVVIHTVKFLCMIIVIHGHRGLYFLSYPLGNTESAEHSLYEPPFGFIHPSLVDVFFMITGYMTFYTGFASMKKRGGILVLINILLRWIRLVPPFCILMLYMVYVLRYTGEGPLWNYKIGDEVSKCEHSWWASFLGINNFVKLEDQCTIISWYISIDLQLAILGEILLYFFTKSKRVGTLLSVLTFIGSICITFGIIYQKQYHGIIRYFLKMLEDVRKEEEYVNLYTTTYPRIAPYLIGFLNAYIIKIVIEKKIKFSLGQVFTISTISFFIGEGYNIYGQVFYDSFREYSLFENAIYGAFYHAAFPLSLAVIYCLYETSGFGVFSKVFEWKYYIFFGRLTYSVFLVHSVVQLYHTSLQKQVMLDASSRLNMTWLAFGDMILCYFIGFIFHLIVEAPMSNLCKILRKKIISFLDDRGKPEVVYRVNESRNLENSKI